MYSFHIPAKIQVSHIKRNYARVRQENEALSVEAAAWKRSSDRLERQSQLLEKEAQELRRQNEAYKQLLTTALETPRGGESGHGRFPSASSSNVVPSLPLGNASSAASSAASMPTYHAPPPPLVASQLTDRLTSGGATNATDLSQQAHPPSAARNDEGRQKTCCMVL